MKLLSINVHSWLETEQIAKLHQLVATILKEDYDVIALQEVNQLAASACVVPPQELQVLSTRSLREDNFLLLLMKLLKRKGANYFGLWTDCHTGYGIYEEGTALLSKYPFIETDVLTFRKELDFANVRRRGIVGGLIAYKGQTSWFYSGHFSWWNFEGEALFQEEWAILEKNFAAKLQQTAPVFLLGDFNNDAAAVNEGYEAIGASGHWFDLFKRASRKQGEHTVCKEIVGWSGNRQKLRIDYIFASRNYLAEEYTVTFDGVHSPVISDHFGVAVTLSDGQLGKEF